MRSAPDPSRVEAWALAAWPTLEQVDYDGWALRFAGGHTKRSNSINPLRRSTIPVEEKIPVCERAYAERGLPTIFRLTPLADPTLDDALAARGYDRIDRTLLMTRPLDNPAPFAPHAAVRSVDASTWLDAFASMDLLPPPQMDLRRRIVAAIPGEMIPLLAGPSDRPTGIHLGVRDGAGVGLFALFVAERARRLGLGRGLVESALRIAAEKGATTAYLQVEEANANARSLYETLGFADAYVYWYRIRRQ